MAKKEYFKLIYLRQEDEDGGYWYAVHARSRYADVVAVLNNPTIRGIKDRLITFNSVKDAEAFMDSGSLPNMGGVWEVVSKWVPKPVSGAQRSLSRQYCQRKRQLAGAAAILKYLCQARVSKDKIGAVLEIENTRLDAWYAYELVKIGEEK